MRTRPLHTDSPTLLNELVAFGCFSSSLMGNVSTVVSSKPSQSHVLVLVKIKTNKHSTNSFFNHFELVLFVVKCIIECTSLYFSKLSLSHVLIYFATCFYL